ncbi:MAG: gamma-glutamyl-gamma-aminobutyrate hydrolase family protein [Deltaproteobacteria bacterium]|nr:gamma-glutamyl-gamma-aminobutyrate hydrolase family protein [Deltaproteobacteria bacterium]
MKLRVAVTCDRRAAGPVAPSARVRPARPEVFVSEHVVSRLREAGAAVVLLPPGDADGGTDLLDIVDALVITGGAFDIHPRHYGEGVSARLDRVDDERTSLELRLAASAMDRDLPVLGLCGGMQAMIVAAGGSLLQHVDGHEQDTDPVHPAHALLVEPGTPAWLATTLGPDSNSTHHQAAGRLGPFRVAARAPDGVIEAVYHPARRFAVGVQGHPELRGGALFTALVSAARGRSPGRGPG